MPPHRAMATSPPLTHHVPVSVPPSAHAAVRGMPRTATRERLNKSIARAATRELLNKSVARNPIPESPAKPTPAKPTPAEPSSAGRTIKGLPRAEKHVCRHPSGPWRSGSAIDPTSSRSTRSPATAWDAPRHALMTKTVTWGTHTPALPQHLGNISQRSGQSLPPQSNPPTARPTIGHTPDQRRQLRLGRMPIAYSQSNLGQAPVKRPPRKLPLNAAAGQTP